MNVADSERMSAALDRLGCTPTEEMEAADIIVLNSCVVRQGAEDKVAGRLSSLAGLKRQYPDRVIALMGCMVGPDTRDLKRRFPHVDCFMRPQEFGPLVRLVEAREGACLDSSEILVPSHPSVATYIPITHGCDKFCTFCIIPYRRGRVVSRPIAEVVQEVEMLAKRGVKEVTLLGQNVDSYGDDLPGAPDLADLLEAVNVVPAIKRIRFLTSHPNDMSDRIIAAVARLEKVCEFVNLPVQAGDDTVLANMRRGYTRDQYLALVGRIRAAMPKVGLTTDIIVGFPGETAEQFERTADLVRRVRFDKVHIAQYSPRPGTISHRKMADDVPAGEKARRFRVLDDLQAGISHQINREMVGTTEEILIEGQKDGKWHGRTRANRLVYIEGDDGHRHGAFVDVEIIKASTWSVEGIMKTVGAGSQIGRLQIPLVAS
jgi:tRNA-2-methylthio-N6-dimethylallyladenosine synthase